MSAGFFVTTPTDNPQGRKSQVYDYYELDKALADFLWAIRNEEWAELHWSS